MAEDASELHSTASRRKHRLSSNSFGGGCNVRCQKCWFLPAFEVMLVKGQRLSHVEEVQRNALETASRTNDFLKAFF